MELFDATDRAWPPDPLEIDLADGSWMTPQQAAAAARVSDRTLWRWLRERDIGLKIGGRVWINRRRLFGR